MSGGDNLMEAVRELALLVGKTAFSYFGKDIAVELKADQSPVTVADKHAEHVAREWVARRFPADGILGEEFGTDRPAARRRWIIDPIDGTKSFIRRVPLWGTLIGVEENGVVLAGAASFPAVDELIVAAPGQGCWWNNVRCSTSAVAELSSATVLTTDNRFPADTERRRAWGAFAARAAVARTWGDCYGYLLVATGRAEVMVDDVASPWDATALLPIIQEAGGVFTDWRGVPTALGGDVIATNAPLAAEVRTLLGVAPSDADVSTPE